MRCQRCCVCGGHSRNPRFHGSPPSALGTSFSQGRFWKRDPDQEDEPRNRPPPGASQMATAARATRRRGPVGEAARAEQFFRARRPVGCDRRSIAIPLDLPRAQQGGPFRARADRSKNVDCA